MARATPSDVSLYNKSVFLNAPLDAQYKPLLDAILFCIHSCGYIARLPKMCESAEITTAELASLDYLPDLITFMIRWIKIDA